MKKLEAQKKVLSKIQRKKTLAIPVTEVTQNKVYLILSQKEELKSEVKQLKQNIQK